MYGLHFDKKQGKNPVFFIEKKSYIRIWWCKVLHVGIYCILI
jgi:hypothetical protein